MNEEPRNNLSVYAIGQNLDEMSVEELDRTVEILKTEIKRLEEIRNAKSSHISAAEALFVKK